MNAADIMLAFSIPQGRAERALSVMRGQKLPMSVEGARQALALMKQRAQARALTRKTVDMTAEEKQVRRVKNAVLKGSLKVVSRSDIERVVSEFNCSETEAVAYLMG